MRQLALVMLLSLSLTAGCTPKGLIASTNSDLNVALHDPRNTGNVDVVLKTKSGAYSSLATLADLDHLSVELKTAADDTTQTVASPSIQSGEASASFHAKAPGAATLGVQAFDRLSRSIGAASTSLTIVAGQKTTANVALTLDTTPQGDVTAVITVSDGGSTSTASGSTTAALTSNASVFQVTPNGQNASLEITGAASAVVAVSNVSFSDTAGADFAWGQSVSAYRAQSLAPLVSHQSGQESFERRLMELMRATRPSVSPYRVQALTGATVTLGSTRSFQIYNDGASKTDTVSATAVYVNDNQGATGSFVIWVDDRDASIFQGSTGQTTLSSVANELQNHIYATDTSLVGVETTMAANAAQPLANQLTMNDDYVNFVFSHSVDNGTTTNPGSTGILGFFTPFDLLSSDGSNRTKALYVAASVASSTSGLEDMYATVAHEFQHLLFFCHRVKAVGLNGAWDASSSSREAWINEGMSMLAMLANGYGPSGPHPSSTVAGHLYNFLAQPNQYSLLEFFQRRGGNPIDAYGMATLFTEYLDEKVGDAAIRDIHNLNNSATLYYGSPSPDNVNPTDLVERAMALHGTSLEQLFPDFAATLALDGTAAEASLTGSQLNRYSFDHTRLNLRSTPIIGGYYYPFNGPAIDGDMTPRLRPLGVSFFSRSNPSLLDLTNPLSSGLSARLILTKSGL